MASAYIPEEIQNQSEPPAKMPKFIVNDPFAQLRNTNIIATSNSSTNQNVELEVKREFARYLQADKSNAPFNPLVFWKENAVEFPFLSKLSRKFFVIQASSGESERHFSAAGGIVSEKRAKLEPKAIEPLVVLHEAMINKMW